MVWKIFDVFRGVGMLACGFRDVSFGLGMLINFVDLFFFL